MNRVVGNITSPNKETFKAKLVRTRRYDRSVHDGLETYGAVIQIVFKSAVVDLG